VCHPINSASVVCAAVGSDSADGFPTSSEGSFEAGLSAGKGKVSGSLASAWLRL